MKIKVDCQAGYRDEQEPGALYLGERRIEVLAIVDRWFGEDYRYFKVNAGDGATYILRHDEPADTWEMTWFNAVAEDRGGVFPVRGSGTAV